MDQYPTLRVVVLRRARHNPEILDRRLVCVHKAQTARLLDEVQALPSWGTEEAA
jgi:hypothetical protein